MFETFPIKLSPLTRLSGSSLCPSLCPVQLAGVGLVNAFKLFDRKRHRNPNRRFSYALQQHHQNTKQKSSSSRRNHPTTNHSRDHLLTYERVLSQAEAVFYHHPVYKDELRHVAYLNSIDQDGTGGTAAMGPTRRPTTSAAVASKPKNPHSFFVLAAPTATLHNHSDKNNTHKKPRPPVEEVVVVVTEVGNANAPSNSKLPQSSDHSSKPKIPIERTNEIANLYQTHRGDKSR